MKKCIYCSFILVLLLLCFINGKVGVTTSTLYEITDSSCVCLDVYAAKVGRKAHETFDKTKIAKKAKMIKMNN